MQAVIDIGANTIPLSVYRKQKQEMKLFRQKKSVAGLVRYIDFKK